MIDPKIVYNALSECGINFYCGVPDSLLKDFCFFISDHVKEGHHIIMPNEGNAVALAAGHYLASGKPALVYMQNSGLGNAVNPLVSLMDPDIYGIPVLLIIGWRGEPGKEDEPQHVKQGKITPAMLETMDIPYSILSDSGEEAENQVKAACKSMEEYKKPFALIIKNGTFEKYSGKAQIKNNYPLTREEAIQCVAGALGSKDAVVSTTGKASRELFEYRKATGSSNEKDFLTVGSMGHASSVALGIAMERLSAKIYCIDGDGAALMHLGAMSAIGSGPPNLVHILINNGVHESVGGQPTAAPKIDFCSVAKACGYKTVLSAESKESLNDKLRSISSGPGPFFLEIKTHPSSRNDLGRPTTKPSENKASFMNFLKK